MIGQFIRATMLAVVLATGFAGGFSLTPALAQAGGAGDAAEIAFWDSVKSSTSPAEVQAYLDRYPNGTFAALAKIRLRNLQGGTTAAPQTPPPGPTPSARVPAPPSVPPASTGSALRDAATIRDVQNRLYNLNYTLRSRNGRLTPETRAAIRKWQENVKQPVTGDMTEAQLALLRRAALPKNWGALAYFTKGATATVWSRPTREAAERDALAQCRKNAGAACSVVTVANNICAALGFYNANVGGRQHWGVYASVRPTLGAATSNALDECRKNARAPNACGVRTTVCADGSHGR